MKALRRLWGGEVSLPIAFWINGVAVLIAATLILRVVLMRLAMAGVADFLFISTGVAAIARSHQVLAAVGVWRSAARYAGPKVWPILARIADSVVADASAGAARSSGLHDVA